MPTIEVNYTEFEQAIGVKEARCRFGNPQTPDLGAIDEALSPVKAEVKGFEAKEGTLSIEMKDTARPDLWSVEGLARGLRSYMGLEKGIRRYRAAKSVCEVNVDPKLWNIRPFICCSIIKGVHLSDEIIKGIMHLQDKLDQTYGRSRQKTSIGIYNFDLIVPPISYIAVKPKETSFIPLGFSEKMNLDEILERHPKGTEYGHIVKKNPLYPMLFDAEGKVLSFPPIINSNDLGKITEDSRNLLVEVTGTSGKAVLDTLNLVSMALIDRGGKANSATINYPTNKIYPEKAVVTPDFSDKSFEVSIEYTNRLLGLNLKATEISKLLLKAGLQVEKASGDLLTVLVPAYRVDVMHQVDIIEDVAVAFGYNNIEALWRELPTTGRAKSDQSFINVARELMVGLGFQETLNYTLTSQENLFQKMNAPSAPLIEVSDPKVVTMTCMRNWLLPSLMEFFSVNQSVEFPQKIFELGKVTLPDQKAETRTRDEDWLAAATSHPNSNFTEIKSALDSFLGNLGVEWQIKEISHPSFIEGRVGGITVQGKNVGVVGEISPTVLGAWKLENPVAAFEVNIKALR